VAIVESSLVSCGSIAVPRFLRALSLLGCLMVVLLLPGVADARSHRVSLDRGETAISYHGSGSTDAPASYYCQGTNPCLAFGNVSYGLSWEATAIADSSGTVRESDTTLQASGVISAQSNLGIPAGATPSNVPDCISDLRERKRYKAGATVTLTRRSVGVQLELPFSLRWLEVSGDPDKCQLSPTAWAGAVFAPTGPRSDRDAAKLLVAVRPKMGAPLSARQTTKKFDYSYERDTGTGRYGVVTDRIVSSVTIINGCKSLNLDTGRCVKYYD
jgi:hypothetical protein